MSFGNEIAFKGFIFFEYIINKKILNLNFSWFRFTSILKSHNNNNNEADSAPKHNSVAHKSSLQNIIKKIAMLKRKLPFIKTKVFMIGSQITKRN